MKPYKGLVKIECTGKKCPKKLTSVIPACMDCNKSSSNIINLSGVNLKNIKKAK